MTSVPYASKASAGRPSRSAFSSESLVSKSSSGKASRTSVLPAASAIRAYIRRRTQGSSDDLAAKDQKPPLLTLKLSNPSYLDSDVSDDITPTPLYTIETQGTATTISRSDPWSGSSKTADIRWPKILANDKGRDMEDALVQLKGGRWKLGSAILQLPTVPDGPRKFHIPGYSKPLKWKRVGNVYWCIASSVSTPIAILEPAAPSSPPRLQVYETLHDKYDSRPLVVHHGVSILLLDYLLVTSLLLVTDIQDWMLVKKYEGSNAEHGTAVPHTAPLTSSSQWRKIMLGEPIFPRRPSSSLSGGTDRSQEHAAPAPSNAQKKQVPNGASRHPKLKSEIYFDTDDEDGDEAADGVTDVASDDDESEEHGRIASTSLRPRDTSRPSSPSTESIYYPHINGAAPNHNYMDPMFYGRSRAPPVPPVPPIPNQYGPRSLNNKPSSASIISSSGSVRRLPQLPPAGASPSVSSSRARFNPPEPPKLHLLDTSTTASTPVNSSFTHQSVARSPSSGRRLPVPPSPIPSVYSPTLSRSPSTHKPLNGSLRSPGSRSLPPTPILPTSSAADFMHAGDGTSKSHVGLIGWTTRTTTDASGRVSIYEVPPPAYNTLNFIRNGTDVSVRPPVPPVPPLNLDLKQTATSS